MRGFFPFWRNVEIFSLKMPHGSIIVAAFRYSTLRNSTENAQDFGNLEQRSDEMLKILEILGNASMKC